jgi:3-oxoacyl-[acyl-carrier protein] reductase
VTELGEAHLIGRRLEGRVALVTGGWRGIGAAVCGAYATEGAAIALNFPPGDRFARDEAVRRASDLARLGAGAIAVEADVSDRGSVAKMVTTVEQQLGAISVLVANAAATGRRSWDEIDEGEWHRVMDVNVTGTLLCSQAVYPSMRAARHGKIITVSSVMVELGAEQALHYVTSKAALIGFTRGLAREVGREGICVNCVMPGAIRTESEEELFPGQSDEIAKEQRKRQSIPRRGGPDDMTGAFVFLASSESDFVTGQVFVVDGGWVNR